MALQNNTDALMQSDEVQKSRLHAVMKISSVTCYMLSSL